MPDVPSHSRHPKPVVSVGRSSARARRAMSIDVIDQPTLTLPLPGRNIVPFHPVQQQVLVRHPDARVANRHHDGGRSRGQRPRTTGVHPIGSMMPLLRQQWIVPAIHRKQDPVGFHIRKGTRRHQPRRHCVLRLPWRNPYHILVHLGKLPLDPQRSHLTSGFHRQDPGLRLAQAPRCRLILLHRSGNQSPTELALSPDR